MKSVKKPASSFPKIPVNVLMRIIEEWGLPRKNQGLPQRQMDARRLAMRLRKTQAALRGITDSNAAESDAWRNITDFLTSSLRQNDFKTLESFCEGFMEFSATAVPIGEGDDGALMRLDSNAATGSGQRIAIARAILILQDRKGHPPYQSEVIKYLSDRERGDDVQNISQEKLSKILAELRLTDLLPKLRVNP